MPTENEVKLSGFSRSLLHVYKKMQKHKRLAEQLDAEISVHFHLVQENEIDEFLKEQQRIDEEQEQIKQKNKYIRQVQEFASRIYHKKNK